MNEEDMKRMLDEKAKKLQQLEQLLRPSKEEEAVMKAWQEQKRQEETPMEFPGILPRPDFNKAEYFYEIVMSQIREFEASLDDEHKVGMELVAFNQRSIVAVNAVGYSNPGALIFYGIVGNQKATLIQHVTQLNLLLIALPKEPEKPRLGVREIGEIGAIGFKAD